ncbi:MAG: UDP-glucose/GDP-mannose dehydrogenase family protein [Methylocella sp.]
MTVISLAEAGGTDVGIVRAWLANSRHRRDWAARTIHAALLARAPQAKVAVWGLAYKENTHSTKNSPSLATLAQFPETRFVVHDPVVPATAVASPHVTGVDDALSALAGAQALMILTPWPEYREIPPSEIASALEGRIVLDPYRVLDHRAALAAKLDYYTLGAPPSKPGTCC